MKMTGALITALFVLGLTILIFLGSIFVNAFGLVVLTVNALVFSIAMMLSWVVLKKNTCSTQTHCITFGVQILLVIIVGWYFYNKYHPPVEAPMEINLAELQKKDYEELLIIREKVAEGIREATFRNSNGGSLAIDLNGYIAQIDSIDNILKERENKINTPREATAWPSYLMVDETWSGEGRALFLFVFVIAPLLIFGLMASWTKHWYPDLQQSSLVMLGGTIYLTMIVFLFSPGLREMFFSSGGIRADQGTLLFGKVKLSEAARWMKLSILGAFLLFTTGSIFLVTRKKHSFIGGTGILLIILAVIFILWPNRANNMVGSVDRGYEAVKNLVPSVSGTIALPAMFGGGVKEEALPTPSSKSHKKALAAGCELIDRFPVEQQDFSRWIDIPNGYQAGILGPTGGWIKIQIEDDGTTKELYIKDNEFLPPFKGKKYRVRGGVGMGRMIVNFYQQPIP